MKVYVVCREDYDEPVVDVFDNLSKADEYIYDHYVRHSEWLKMFEQEVI